MRILGLDTSTRAGSVAICEGGRIRALLGVDRALDHSLRLLPSVEFLLARFDPGLKGLDAIAVTRGPGSFTGVRVGLATARGLGQSAGIPVVGVPTLEALAEAAEPPAETWVCPWIDAGRGQIYAAAYLAGPDGPVEKRPPAVEEPGDWLVRLPPVQALFVGDGAEAHAGRLAGRGGALPGPWFLAPAAARLAELRLGRGDREPPEPIYVRSSDAEAGRSAR